MDMKSSTRQAATLLRNAVNRNNNQLVVVAEEGQSVSKEPSERPMPDIVDAARFDKARTARKGRGRQRRS
jgi:hypothetical protein